MNLRRTKRPFGPFPAMTSLAASALAALVLLAPVFSLPARAQAAAQAKGREPFEVFVETLGRRLASGKSVLREVSIDMQAGASEKGENGSMS